MKDFKPAAEVMDQLTKWAEHQPAVRALLLTSSRANPNAPVDFLSDYDVILVVEDIHPFFEDRRWLQDFGEVLVAYWDPIHPEPESGIEMTANVIQFVDGLHIDFTLWPVALMRQVATAGTLPDGLDEGYRILLDKDHLTDRMLPPTFRAYLPKPPTEAEFQKVVEDFFSDVPYVAKCLWRDELMPAKWCLDYDMKYLFLRPMLEWRSAIDHNWSVPEGNLGKGLKKKLPARIWADLESTYAAAGIEENWEALFRMLSLFRTVGIEVAGHFGYAYPLEMDQRVTAYAQEIRNMDGDV